MFKQTFLTGFLCLTASLNAQISRGFVKEGLTLRSDILGKEVRYSVYLPFDYETSSRYYPVVYLLHGYTDDDTGWIQFGEAHLIADQAVSAREIPPMILIMPDAGVSWYINNHDGSVRYEDFFVQEFMPYIEDRFRIRKERRYRAVAGLSMGGFGALVYASRHPELFSACAAFSAAVFTDDQIIHYPSQQWSAMLKPVFGPDLQGKNRLTNHLKKYSPVHIFQNSDPEKLKTVRWYLDCGDDDFLTIGNMQLHFIMREKNIQHEFRVRDGGHQWSYWRSGLKKALAFIGTGFHQP